MSLNIPGLVVLFVFYLVILAVGIFAAKRKKLQNAGSSTLDTSIVAGRSIGAVVGIFTMTATTVGGGYINGTAESIATGGLVWTLAPFGIFLGLNIGGLVFARRMRNQMYLTMLDPFQEVYGSVVVFLVYLASVAGDIFWTASILSALGTSLSVILDLSRTVAIAASAAVTVGYTMVGQMISVAYTDIVQLIFITGGLVLCIPFVLTNENVGDIGNATSVWIGQFDTDSTSQWIDLFIAMTFGTIPWQAYFQRVLSVTSAKEAQVLSMVGGASALILVIPSVLIGASAVSADWTNTSLGMSPMAADKSDMVLPYVLNEFTPVPVAVIGLGAISAAVMSSMDSSVLASSSMFTNNIYKQIVRPKASDRELLWTQRLAILCIGILATVTSLFVPGVYGLFILAADIVFVIVLPQLVCAVFLKWTNQYGAVCGYVLGTVLRVGAGEPSVNLEPFIFYPMYDDSAGQKFPFRTFAMTSSLFVIVLVSVLTNELGLPTTKTLSVYTLQPCDSSPQHQRDGQRNCSCSKSSDCDGYTNCDCSFGADTKGRFTNCSSETGITNCSRKDRITNCSRKDRITNCRTEDRITNCRTEDFTNCSPEFTNFLDCTQNGKRSLGMYGSGDFKNEFECNQELVDLNSGPVS